MTPQEMKMISLKALEAQLGVLPGSPAWVNSTESAIRPVEAEVQTPRATTIWVIGVWQKHGVRMRNAWTNDFSALLVCCNVLLPWETIIKIDNGLSWPVADVIESVSGKPVQ